MGEASGVAATAVARLIEQTSPPFPWWAAVQETLSTHALPRVCTVGRVPSARTVRAKSLRE